MKKPEIFYTVPNPVQETSDPLAGVISYPREGGMIERKSTYSRPIMQKNSFGLIQSQEIAFYEQRQRESTTTEAHYVSLQTPLDQVFFQSLERTFSGSDDTVSHQRHIIRLFHQRMPHIIISPREVALCITSENSRIPLIVMSSANGKQERRVNRAIGNNGMIQFDTQGKLAQEGNSYRTSGGDSYPWSFETVIAEGMPIITNGKKQKTILLAGLEMLVPFEKITVNTDAVIVRTAFKNKTLHTHYQGLFRPFVLVESVVEF